MCMYHERLQPETHPEERQPPLQHSGDGRLQVEVVRRTGTRRQHHQVRFHRTGVHLRLQEVGERAAAPQSEHGGSGLAQVVGQGVHEAVQRKR